MQPEILSTTIHVRVTPGMYADLLAAAERGDETVGALTRRALRAELDGAEAHRLDPYVNLPFPEVKEMLDRVLETRGDPARLQEVVTDIGDHLVDLLDAGFLTLDVLHDGQGGHSLLRAAGFLQQGSDSLLRAAYLVRSLIVQRDLATGGLQRIMAEQQRQEG